ncbi:MAG TPA: hypothetical protein VGV87_07675 [Blastocatellia bacterium]|nr:hypothetical protein [Blastocatellia bacterium]
MSTPPPYGNPQEGYPGGGYPPPPGGYQGGGYPPLPPRRSGYVGQVTVVAILMIVQGSLVALIGLALMIIGPAMFALSGSGHQAQDERIITQVGGVFYLLFGGLLVGAGGLNIVAAVKNLKYRGRTLGITALCLGTLAMFTCYCAPTAIGLLIYGLIIYLNQDVSRAFEMGEQGASPDQIKNSI